MKTRQPQDGPEDRERTSRAKALANGPRVVGIGGGTGLSVLLRGLKKLTSNLTAVVTVTDDGGSSGRLREELGILPPGDIRNCLLALAEAEPLMHRLFQHRFHNGSGLAGHSFGNLFLAAMTEITGDLETAVRESSKVLAVRGRVLPATLDDVTLCAVLQGDRVVRGESQIPLAGRKIEKIFLDPPAPKALEEAVEAVLEADLVVLGPGSLFTSVIPNLLIPGLAGAVNRTGAPVVYVCNVMTQRGETDGMNAADHLAALGGYLKLRPHAVVVNIGVPPKAVLARYALEGAAWVEPALLRLNNSGTRVITGDLLSRSDLAHHDPEVLAKLVLAGTGSGGVRAGIKNPGS